MVRRFYPASRLGEQGGVPMQLPTIGIDLGKTLAVLSSPITPQGFS
jgi:hypothetical protein